MNDREKAPAVELHLKIFNIGLRQDETFKEWEVLFFDCELNGKLMHYTHRVPREELLKFLREEGADV